MPPSWQVCVNFHHDNRRLIRDYARNLPDGSVWNSRGVPSSSKPVIRADIPKGLLPFDWVYLCFSWAINLVMYSKLTRSSTVSLCDWHSILARSIRILASAVKPANAINTWLSMEQIFLMVLSTWSFATDFFSTASTTTWSPLTPTWIIEVIQWISNWASPIREWQRIFKRNLPP